MGTGSTKTSSQPWGPQAQQFRQLFRQFDQSGIRDRPLEYFPDSTIAGRNPWSTMANQNIANLVGTGSQGLNSAIAENQRTSEGYYLRNTNPYLRDIASTAGEDISRMYNMTVMPAIASRFAGAGRSAGPTSGVANAEGAAISAAQRDLGQELSQMVANLYGGAYESERGRQGTAVAQAPGLRQAQFADQAALSAAGADEFQYAQMQLSDLVNRWNFQQYEPFERYGMYQGLISQPSGYGETKNTSKLGTAQYIGMIGSALTPSLASLFGGDSGGGMIPPGKIG